MRVVYSFVAAIWGARVSGDVCLQEMLIVCTVSHPLFRMFLVRPSMHV